MKIFSLAKAETKKITSRPISIVLLVLLILLVGFLQSSFSPKPFQQTKVDLTETNVGFTFQNFLDDGNENGKTKLDEILIGEKDKINAFVTKITNENTLEQLTAKISQAKIIKETVLPPTILQLNQNPSTENINNATNELLNLKSKSLEIMNFLSNEQESQITFFITVNNYNTLREFFRKIAQNIPSTFSTAGQILSTYESIKSKFDFSSIIPIVQSITRISTSNIDELLINYYTNILDNSNLNNHEPTLNALYNEMYEFAMENESSTSSENLEAMNEYFSKYKSIVIMAKTTLDNEFILLITKNEPENLVKSYVGFEDFNRYELNQDAKYYNYLLSNGKFDYDYLKTFSYNQNSQSTTNAFDFVIYAMQISSFLITVFVIFIASGTIVTEQNNGTLKMIAIRPFTRKKILSGKLRSCLILAVIYLLVTFVLSFAIGYFMFGVSSLNALIVFNANIVFEINAFLLILIYFILILIKIAFYVTFALLISMIFNSNALAIVISIATYIFTLIANVFLISSTWLMYLPTSHLDLFAYFGSSSNNELFDFFLPFNASFYSSLVISLFSIMVFYLASLLIFKKREID